MIYDYLKTVDWEEQFNIANHGMMLKISSYPKSRHIWNGFLEGFHCWSIGPKLIHNWWVAGGDLFKDEILIRVVYIPYKICLLHKILLIFQKKNWVRCYEFTTYMKEYVQFWYIKTILCEVSYGPFDHVSFWLANAIYYFNFKSIVIHKPKCEYYYFAS